MTIQAIAGSSVDVSARQGAAHNPAALKQRQFQRIFVIGFVLFLLVALIARLLPRRWRPWLCDSRQKPSIIAEARAAANTFLPLAYLA